MIEKQYFENKKELYVTFSNDHGYFFNEFNKLIGSTRKGVYKVLEDGNLIYELYRNKGYVLETADFRYYYYESINKAISEFLS